MPKQSAIQLKVEYFSGSDESKYRIYAEQEKKYILQSIQKKHARIAIYYDINNHFILTTLLQVTERGIWLDVGPDAAENEKILRTSTLIFVSSNQQVKVQFSAHKVADVSFEGQPAFFLPLPEFLLRIQRREHFRLSVPVSTPVVCIIPIPTAHPDKPQLREIAVINISVGGIALLCDANEIKFQPGNIFHHCKISLAHYGLLETTIEVRDNVSFELPFGMVKKMVGCKFIFADNQASVLLQKYINYLQAISNAERA